MGTQNKCCKDLTCYKNNNNNAKKKKEKAKIMFGFHTSGISIENTGIKASILMSILT